MTPASVNETNVYKVWQNLYGKEKTTQEKTPKYQVGDHVRISVRKKEKKYFIMENHENKVQSINPSSRFDVHVYGPYYLSQLWLYVRRTTSRPICIFG
ncbi:hypothetical protein J437_LFUL018032 [Ladona fulva]|uniref:Uncharacterized protein n=1 Tax=Ladona fulva TaxID=123851 RepID=A0A8K0P765_LADFU|nr:hypothetical protein J437_LFUL018032 [Ladona fulva]